MKRRRIRNLTPAAACILVLSLAEHDGEPYPETCRAPGFASITWKLAPRTVRVVVHRTFTEIEHVDAETVRTFVIREDLVACVRDALDWLRGLPLDRGPIPLPTPEPEPGKDA